MQDVFAGVTADKTGDLTAAKTGDETDDVTSLDVTG
jgi:hypothetical protein